MGAKILLKLSELPAKRDGVTWMDHTRSIWDKDFHPTRMQSKLWRLNNLYVFVDATGKVQRFIMRPGMFDAKCTEWWFNVLLKARQYGFSTFFLFDMLDDILFRQHITCQLTAHKLEDAQKLFDRVKFAYENIGFIPDGSKPHAKLSRDEWSLLGQEVRAAARIKRERAEELQLANGSSIRVTTSGRSGTLQRLHVSELGKLAAKDPEKAREVQTGSIPAAKMGKVWIESTAEGEDGLFFDICQNAQQLRDEKRPLTRNEYRFHFHPWWADPDYVLPMEDAAQVPVPQRMRDYFDELQAEGIVLSRQQQAWYVIRSKDLGADMRREFPSTPEEAFASTIEGAIFGRQMKQARIEKRLCKVPVTDGTPINTYWDLGVDDYMAVWLCQTVGQEHRMVGFLEGQGEGIQYYAEVLNEWRNEYGWNYGTWWAPHDIMQREMITGQSRFETAARYGIYFEVAPQVRVKQDAIQAAINIFPSVWFDRENCAEGIVHLDNYRREWDERLGRFKLQPRHDDHSHAADAFVTFAQTAPTVMRTTRAQARPVRQVRWVA